MAAIAADLMLDRLQALRARIHAAAGAGWRDMPHDAIRSTMLDLAKLPANDVAAVLLALGLTHPDRSKRANVQRIEMVLTAGWRAWQANLV